MLPAVATTTAPPAHVTDPAAKYSPRHNYGLHSCGLYSYGPAAKYSPIHNYGLHSCGLYSYGPAARYSRDVGIEAADVQWSFAFEYCSTIEVLDV